MTPTPRACRRPRPRRRSGGRMEPGRLCRRRPRLDEGAEHLENIWWQMHQSTKSPDAANMRRSARAAIIRRDQTATYQP